jgi:hypothetical protein
VRAAGRFGQAGASKAAADEGARASAAEKDGLQRRVEELEKELEEARGDESGEDMKRVLKGKNARIKIVEEQMIKVAQTCTVVYRHYV